MNYPNNQVGINDLLVVDVPFEVTVKLKSVDVRGFGDVAYNLDGRERAEAAAAGYAAYLSNVTGGSTISGFSPQTSDVMAYQFGVAVGSHNRRQARVGISDLLAACGAVFAGSESAGH